MIGYSSSRSQEAAASILEYGGITNRDICPGSPQTVLSLSLYQLVVSGSGSDPLWFLVQIEALKLLSQEDLVSWFLEHRNNSRKLSVHVSLFEDKNIRICFSLQETDLFKVLPSGNEGRFSSNSQVSICGTSVSGSGCWLRGGRERPTRGKWRLQPRRPTLLGLQRSERADLPATLLAVALRCHTHQ